MTRWPTVCSACRATTARTSSSRWENLDNAHGHLSEARLTKIAALKPGDDAIDEARRRGAAREVQRGAGQRPQHLARPSRRSTTFSSIKTNDATKLYRAGRFRQGPESRSSQEGRRRRARAGCQRRSRRRRRITIISEIRRAGCRRRSADPARAYEAKKAKNFAEADRIRDELKAQGIESHRHPRRRQVEAYLKYTQPRSFLLRGCASKGQKLNLWEKSAK